MAKFLGRFVGKIDYKGRVVLPARFQHAMPPESDVTLMGVVREKKVVRCLALFPLPEFRAMLARVADSRLVDAEARYLFGLRLLDAVRLEIDNQGRMTIPPEVCFRVGFKRDVVFIGIEGSIEMWAPDQLDSYFRDYGFCGDDEPRAS